MRRVSWMQARQRTSRTGHAARARCRTHHRQDARAGFEDGDVAIWNDDVASGVARDTHKKRCAPAPMCCTASWKDRMRLSLRSTRSARFGWSRIAICAAKLARKRRLGLLQSPALRALSFIYGMNVGRHSWSSASLFDARSQACASPGRPTARGRASLVPSSTASTS